MLRLNKAVFEHASGNRWKHKSVPSRALSREATRIHSKWRFLETGKEERRFALNMLLEKTAKCGHTQEEVRNGISQRAEPNSAIRGKSLPKFAEEVGNYWRIIKIWGRTLEDQCTDVGMIHVILNESSHPSWTELYREYGSVQEHWYWGDPGFIQYHSKIGTGPFWRDSECESNLRVLIPHE